MEISDLTDNLAPKESDGTYPRCYISLHTFEDGEKRNLPQCLNMIHNKVQFVHKHGAG